MVKPEKKIKAVYDGKVYEGSFHVPGALALELPISEDDLLVFLSNSLAMFAHLRSEVDSSVPSNSFFASIAVRSFEVFFEDSGLMPLANRYFSFVEGLENGQKS